MIEVPFASYEGGSTAEQNSRETLINMFAVPEVSGRKRIIRKQRPGLELVYAITGEKRCIERHKGNHYCVIDATLYRFNGTTLTTLGTIGSNSGRCTMIFNDNDEIMVSDGLAAWYYNGTTVQSVNAPAQVGPLAYQGGFGIFNGVGVGQFYITNLNNFGTIDALDFATAESQPDNLSRVFVDHNELWLFGDRSTEVWQLSGATDFPFARFTNAQIERGIKGRYSVAADDNTVFWLGDDLVVYRADGYRPVRISTHPVEHLISELSAAVQETADAFVYTNKGSKFYTLRFTNGVTLQYNIASGLWNKARTFDYADWRVIGSAGHYTDYYLTDAGISKLTAGLSTDDGGIMEAGGITAPGYMNDSRISVYAFFLDAEMGRASIGAASDIMLRVSRDGESFGNERWRSLGPTGSYRRRAVWRNLGMGREFMIEFMKTAPTELQIISAQAEYDEANG
jgi:hypothetical protein